MTAEVPAQAARLLSGGAAMLAGAVLADSAIEHYRGSFENRAMALPIAASALSLTGDGARAIAGRGIGPPAYSASVHAASAAIGAAGIGFHVYNVTKKPGGFSWNNVFYSAPLGAPAALVVSGVLGAAGSKLAQGATHLGPFSLLPGRFLAGVTAVGLAGTAAEAALLHFRGAYHNPAMWLPVAVVPVAALALAGTAITGKVTVVTTAALAATAALGLAGSGFHIYGVARNMGGWKNWRQNVLAGPPIPAPPSFTGLAIAGLGALLLMRRSARV